MKRVLIAFFLLTFAGTYISEAQGVKPPKKGKAVVYFVRYTKFNKPLKIEFYHNKNLINKIKGESYFRYECNPGKHVFWARAENLDFVSANLKANQIYVVVVDVKPGANKGKVGLTPAIFSDQKEWRKITNLVINNAPSNMPESDLIELRRKRRDYIEKNFAKYKTKLEGKKKYAHLAQALRYNNTQNSPDLAQKTNPVVKETNQTPGNLEQNKPESFTSDIDINIPESKTKLSNSFALIIGNEDYNTYQTGLSSEVNVDYAERDARAFKEYAVKTLGIPEENVILMINARVVEFSKSINKMKAISKALNGEAEIYLYYAGHGFPDEVTKEPYLMPVDVSGSDLQFAIKLNDIYKDLTEYPAKRITVFLDACFSGGARNQGLLAARAVKIQPKENLLHGNLVVFSASSGTQSALPFHNQQHGIFTYYLLKKIQETEGDLYLSELSEYLKKQVGVKSIMINDKEQNPQINISPDAVDTWKEWKLK